MVTSRKFSSILALDVGERRIGVARASLDVPFPGPLTTLDKPETFVDDVVALVDSEDAGALVIGLPRNLSGQDTAQTAAVRAFAGRLEGRLQVPVYWTDEAVTSAKAEEELRSRGKPYAKGDIDALAATYILDDFIREHPEKING